MKSFLVLFTLVLLVGMTSCAFFKDKALPELKQKAADTITKSIVKIGECNAVGVIQSDVEKLLKIESDDSMVVNALGSSAPDGAQEEGMVSEICKAAASLALPTLLAKGVPSKWECALTDLNSKIGDLAVMACGKISL